MKIILLLSIGLIIPLISCTHSGSSGAFIDPDGDVYGTVYSLPKHVLIVEGNANFRTQKTITSNFIINNKESTVATTTAISLNLKLNRDERRTYIVDAKRGWSNAGGFNINLSNEGIIESVNDSSIGKTGETITNVASFIGKVGAFSAFLSESSDSNLDVVSTISDIDSSEKILLKQEPIVMQWYVKESITAKRNWKDKYLLTKQLKSYDKKIMLLRDDYLNSSDSKIYKEKKAFIDHLISMKKNIIAEKLPLENALSTGLASFKVEKELNPILTSHKISEKIQLDALPNSKLFTVGMNETEINKLLKNNYCSWASSELDDGLNFNEPENRTADTGVEDNFPDKPENRTADTRADDSSPDESESSSQQPETPPDSNLDGIPQRSTHKYMTVDYTCKNDASKVAIMNLWLNHKIIVTAEHLKDNVIQTKKTVTTKDDKWNCSDDDDICGFSEDTTSDSDYILHFRQPSHILIKLFHLTDAAIPGKTTQDTLTKLLLLVATKTETVMHPDTEPFNIGFKSGNFSTQTLAITTNSMGAIKTFKRTNTSEAEGISKSASKAISNVADSYDNISKKLVDVNKRKRSEELAAQSHKTALLNEKKRILDNEIALAGGQATEQMQIDQAVLNAELEALGKKNAIDKASYTHELDKLTNQLNQIKKNYNIAVTESTIDSGLQVEILKAQLSLVQQEALTAKQYTDASQANALTEVNNQVGILKANIELLKQAQELEKLRKEINDIKNQTK